MTIPVLLLEFLPPPAYIGPGAGIAFLGSFLLLFAALALAFFSALSFPIRAVLLLVRRRRKRGRAVTGRAVILGMDGLDPGRVRQMIARGELPNLATLAAVGGFTELATTTPPISPVAWSTFMTGVNPGKHNIFDFLNRDLRTYMPRLSSCRVSSGAGRGRRGKYVALRKSKPFWKVLAEYGVFSTVLRVPVTFPPEPFRGLLLSAMCAPDLRGTQGTFTVFEAGADSNATQPTGGIRVPVEIRDGMIVTRLPGPETERGTFSAKLTIALNDDGESADLRTGAQRIVLRKGEYSDWIRLKFRAHLRTAWGMCRFLMVEAGESFKLYATPINIDPGRPAVPVSHPLYYSMYLSKLQGAYATLGLAEDTWALNEGIISSEQFLRQAYDIQEEREKMFFEAMRRTRKGVCCCVFDLPDRIQHMFSRPTGEGGAGKDAVEEAYRRMDAVVGRTLKMTNRKTVIMVLSDHGFSRFDRGVNLNSWLREEGYMELRPEADGREYLADVDWASTRSYTFGLSGIYLNLQGRESKGIVLEGTEKKALKDELIARLSDLRDPITGERAIRTVYDCTKIYSGPYAENGPDLVVGYEAGYRASWEVAVGRTDGPVFTDNTRHWNGDHCVDPSLVPGVFFCNREFDVPEGGMAMLDMAPSILALFGIKAPAYMDGTATRIYKTQATDMDREVV